MTSTCSRACIGTSIAVPAISPSPICQAVARGVPELHIMDLEQVGLDRPSQRGHSVDVEPFDSQVLLLVQPAVRRRVADVSARRPVLA